MVDDRFGRQRGIPGWDQEGVGGATAVIVGVGALGNEVAKNLALAGVGRLILCDPDTVAETNLSRAVLFGPDDIGEPKVIVAAAALRRLVPGIVVESRPLDLVAGVGLGELADAGVVLGCLDTRRARLRLLGRAALVGAALVDGGTDPWGGEVRLRLAAEDPCYGCSLSPHQRGESDLPWSCAEPPPDGPAPASILSTSIVAGWMALAALRILFGMPPRYRILSIDGATGHTAPVTVARDPGCLHHRPLEGPIRPLPVDHRATVADLLAALPADAEPLLWSSIPVAGNCLRCGSPYDHTATSVSSCLRCGQPVRVRRSERLRDAGSGRALRDLGIAPEEILPVRRADGEFQWYRLAS